MQAAVLVHPEIRQVELLQCAAGGDTGQHPALFQVNDICDVSPATSILNG